MRVDSETTGIYFAAMSYNTVRYISFSISFVQQNLSAICNIEDGSENGRIAEVIGVDHRASPSPSSVTRIKTT